MTRSRRLTLAVASLLVAAGTAASALAEETRYFNYSSNRWESGEPTARRMSQASRRPAPQFLRRDVRIETAEAPGTIIVDSQRKFLYYVEGQGRATRYGVGVGREGFGWSGAMKVGRKAEWPGWTPPKEMIARERLKGRILPAFMEGGPENPLGARALYLYRNGADSMFRIHGTNQPWTIGQNMSSGCIRMMNEDVADLYERAGRGTKVVVIGPNGEGDRGVYREAGVVSRAEGLLDSLFGG